MSNFLGGFPKVVLNITDSSTAPSSGFKGVIAVLGITERGEPNKPVLVRSWEEYRRFFGNLVPYSLFPLFCTRAVDRGGTLLVSRVAHYADITDLSTATAIKATGTLTQGTDSAVFTAKSHGTWGNSVKVTTSPAISGEANKLDILVELLNDPTQNQTLYDVSDNPSNAERDLFNSRSRHVVLGAVTNRIPVGNVTLSGGTNDYSQLVDSDYIGHVSTETGFHAFDNFSEPVKICVPESTDAEVQYALVQYVTQRKDMLAILRTPSNIDGYEAIEFRNKTGPYSGGIKINSWQALMFYGDLKVIDPLTNMQRDIHCIGDVLGIMSAKDSVTDPWVSFAGKEYGTIKNCIGVTYNLASPARAAEADKVVLNRINPVVDHPTFGIVVFGSETLQVADTFLKHANIAELLIYLSRHIPNIAKAHMFKPNDIPTWREIYLDVSNFMDYVANRRGVYGPEGIGWKYDGDQHINDVADATVNTIGDIQNGIYRFNLFIKPTPLAKYIGINVSVTNINVDYSLTFFDS